MTKILKLPAGVLVCIVYSGAVYHNNFGKLTYTYEINGKNYNIGLKDKRTVRDWYFIECERLQDVNMYLVYFDRKAIGDIGMLVCRENVQELNEYL